MTTRASSEPSPPKTIGVKEVATESLKPNPHNPRVLFDREPMRRLEESIRRVGILVPLTVYQAKGDEKYTILDGQRRWTCAGRIGLAKVPVNEVEEPNLTQNIVTMFQIHKLRLDWELMPTALKLGVLMDALKERRDKPLAELTGLDVAVVQRCKKLLWYPKEYQDLMLFTEPKQRVKADFFIELYPIITDRLVVKADWYKRNNIIDRILEKYEKRRSGIKSITDFRKIKQHITAARRSGHEAQILKRLKEFIEDDELTIDHLEIAKAAVHRRAATLARAVQRINADISEIEAADFYGEEDLWVELEKLLKTIVRKLDAADRRFR